MHIDEFILVEEVENGPAFASELFQRKYRLPVPKFPHHVVAFCRNDDGSCVPACYAHSTDCGDLILGGGACSDDRVLRRMSADQRAAIRAAGGLYLHTLKWSLNHFGPGVRAIFSYCGDALAERVDLAVGFEQTEHPNLLVYWTREVDEKRRRQLIAKAFSFIPF